jgi:hypothetical protein
MLKKWKFDTLLATSLPCHWSAKQASPRFREMRHAPSATSPNHEAVAAPHDEASRIDRVEGKM